MKQVQFSLFSKLISRSVWNVKEDDLCIFSSHDFGLIVFMASPRLIPRVLAAPLMHLGKHGGSRAVNLTSCVSVAYPGGAAGARAPPSDF